MQGIELATESIPGCVLQLYAWLNSPEEAGKLALASIGISALTTGYTSAMIAFDMDLDAERRKTQARLYGYVPDDNGLRGRAFKLMTLISALHNLSRSVGCALIVASPNGKNLLAIFLGVEMAIYLLFKIARNDFFYFLRIDGPLAVVIALFERVFAKIILDFTGCLHMR